MQANALTEEDLAAGEVLDSIRDFQAAIDGMRTLMSIHAQWVLLLPGLLQHLHEHLRAMKSLTGNRGPAAGSRIPVLRLIVKRDSTAMQDRPLTWTHLNTTAASYLLVLRPRH